MGLPHSKKNSQVGFVQVRLATSFRSYVLLRPACGLANFAQIPMGPNGLIEVFSSETSFLNYVHSTVGRYVHSLSLSKSTYLYIYIIIYLYIYTYVYTLTLS